MDENPIPLWQRLAAGGAILILVAGSLVFRSRLGADFWPIDDSHVAPNILASAIQVLLVTPFAVLLWPPTRRRLHRFVDRKLEPLHQHFAKVHAHQEWQANQQAKQMRAAGLEPDAHPHFVLSPHEQQHIVKRP